MMATLRDGELGAAAVARRGFLVHLPRDGRVRHQTNLTDVRQLLQHHRDRLFVGCSAGCSRDGEQRLLALIRVSAADEERAALVADDATFSFADDAADYLVVGSHLTAVPATDGGE